MLLRHLIENTPSSPMHDKYVQEDAPADDDGSVDNEINLGPDYVPMVKPGSKGKGKNKTFPTTDKAENSLVQTLWFYNNSDAS